MFISLQLLAVSIKIRSARVSSASEGGESYNNKIGIIFHFPTRKGRVGAAQMTRKQAGDSKKALGTRTKEQVPYSLQHIKVCRYLTRFSSEQLYLTFHIIFHILAEKSW